MNETFWDRFQQLRDSLNLNAIEFDRRYGISRENQKNWQHRGTQPDARTLEELSTIFGVTMDYLWSGTIRTDADRNAARALAARIAEGPADPPTVRRRRPRRGAPGSS